MNKLTMGDRIKEARRKCNLTQEELSEKLDVTSTYISELERGLKLPSMQLFLKLLEILNVSADYLVHDEVPRGDLYGDKILAKKIERLKPKQRIALEALIDTYIEYLD